MHKIWQAVLGRAPETGPEVPYPKIGFTPDESIKLDTAEDMASVRALIHVLQDEPDKARSLIRAMSSRDRAVLSFDLSELSRLVEDEEMIRTAADRRKARLSREGQDG